MTNSVCKYLLSQDIAYDCKDPIVGGVEPNGVIINRDDIDFANVKFDDNNPNIITDLPLKNKGYKILQGGKTPFTGTNTAFVEGTYVNTFTHQVSLVVLDNGADVAKNIIDGLANGEFVIVLENNYKGLNKGDGKKGSAAFQIYGYFQGLHATEISNDKYSEDTDGGWLVTLEETKSPKSGMFLFKTDYEGSKAAFDALTSEPSA